MSNPDRRGQWTQQQIDAEILQFQRLQSDLRFRRNMKIIVGIGMIIAFMLALAFCLR